MSPPLESFPGSPSVGRRATPIAELSEMTPELAAMLAATCFPPTLPPPEVAAEAAAQELQKSAELVASVRRGSLAQHGWFALELYDVDEYPSSGGASGLYLDVSGASKRKGASLIAWPAGGGVEGPAVGDMFGKGTWSVPENQLWRHEKASGCLHSMLTDEGVAHKGLVADVQGNKANPGTKVVTWAATGAVNQVFKVGKVGVLQPWAPTLPSMASGSSQPSFSAEELRGAGVKPAEAPDAVALEITTGRRVTPLGEGYDAMPPEVAALLLNTPLPPQSSHEKPKQKSNDGGGGGGSSGSDPNPLGHGGGLLVEIACDEELGGGGEALVLGVPTGAAAGAASRRQSTLQFKVNGPVSAGAEVVTVPAATAARGAGGGYLCQWRVVPVHPNIPLPMRRGS